MPLSMPYIPGAAWLPQYSGESHTLSEFKERLCSLFKVYPLSEDQKVNILIGQLTGAALREVKAWQATDKETVAKVLAKLRSTFDTRPAAEIKMRFFGCKQRAPDSIRDYALNLQEALRAVKQDDPDSVKEEDKLLKEQFIEGLLSSTHRGQLRILTMQTPDLNLADFKDKAIRVLQEPTDSRPALQRHLAITYHQETTPFPSIPVEADTQTLDKDPMEELQVQKLTKGMAALTKTVQSLQEYSKEKVQLASSPEDVPWLRRWRTPQLRGRNNDRYDQNGRPICHHCYKADHLARYCPLDKQPLRQRANPKE
ncbi:uncharacterized protein [Dendrobates tinctorius]|uniref:uncharacterized protein n=1 Tax=Dendrobates tinctorius TaxID=92724 RepID=UPI003CC93548